MESGLSNIKRLFDCMVSLITAVFSFLPPWCLVFVGSVFVFVIGVFIYKLIRG